MNCRIVQAWWRWTAALTRDVKAAGSTQTQARQAWYSETINCGGAAASSRIVCRRIS
jgi:hypothetical protein